MKRIVYTLAVGKGKFAQCALGLGRSLKLCGDTTKRVIVTDQLNHPWDKSFDEVLPPDGPPKHIFLSKLYGLDRTDADQVLFIDADSLAFKRLGPIFDSFAGKGFGVQGRWISNGHWYGNVAEQCARHAVQSIAQFNGGLIYYERCSETQSFVKQVQDLAQEIGDGFRRDDGLIPEEPIIGLAMAKTRFGHLAPEESDFTNTATGLIGRLELDVLRGRCSFVCRRHEVRRVQPFIFHAARYINSLAYWKQLDRLASLEAFEMNHPYGYMSPWQKLHRSISKRILTHVLRKL